jgi:uncharacterized protein YfaS (alpha-2-macroglobulin family)
MTLPRTGFLVAAAYILILGAVAAQTAHAPARSPVPSSAPVPAPAGRKSAPADDAWAAVERLIKEQKIAQAAKRLEALRAGAERRGDEAAWTRALVRLTEVRIALGGFESAVRQLREARWPPGQLARTGLDLYFAHALRTYVAAYSWEINDRERVGAGGANMDLKLWTREQIVGAAGEAFLAAWKSREALGALPVARLSGVVVANNYPPEVRGTLRDAVTYLFVDLLADSSLWTPEETSDVYRLDLSRLLALDGGGAGATASRLGDAGTHPLEKLVAVLADLEAWHAKAGRRAAALEARLERARRLHAAFTRQADRRRIRADLAARLAPARDLAWWAEGQAVLAGLRQEENEPGALIEARAAALAGEQAYPRSRGAQDCRRIAATIESPAFQVQAMTSDGLGRRSIAVDHRNLKRLFFRAYAVDVRRRLESGEDEPFPDDFSARQLLASGPPAASWVVDLPATPDFRQHRTWVVPAIAAPGAYVVLASAKEAFAENRNQVVAMPLVLGNLVVLGGEEPGGATLLRVVSGALGEPAAGAEVRVFQRDWQRGTSAVATLTTAADGTVRLPARPDGSAYSRYLALVRRGRDLALLELNRYPRQQPASGAAVLFFTDRSIYRPGQTLRWKALVYSGDRAAGHLALEPHRSLAVKLVDPNGQEVATTAVSTNDYGTAAGDLVVPAGRPLGSWELRADVPGRTAVQIEEYKRPTFEITLREPADAPRLNRPAVFRGEARYYFGLPVASGKVRWRVTRAPVFPAWWLAEWISGIDAAERSDQVVAAGTAALGADGTFTARFTPEADEELGRDVAYSYSLHAEATDEGGETREAHRTFRLGFVAVEAAIESERDFVEPDTAAAMTIRRRDLDGTPRPGAGSWRLLRLVQPAEPRLPADEPIAPPARPGAAAALSTPGDALAPRWRRGEPQAAALRRCADGAEVAHGDLAHGETGSAVVRLPPLAPGAYRLRYETRDDFGGTATAQRELLVAGEAPLAVAAWLAIQRPSARVGETVEALVHSGFPGQELELEIRRAGGLERRRIVAAGVPRRVELVVREEDRGGIALRLVAVRDHQLLQRDAEVTVPWDNRELQVQYETFRDLLRPGARETWRVKVTRTGPQGAEPAVAELLAYMYDRSLDAYEGHYPPRPLGLFPQGVAVGRLEASLGHQQAVFSFGERLWEPPAGAGLRADSPRQMAVLGGGGPGQSEEQLVMMPLPSPAGTISIPGGVAGGVVGGIAGGVEGGVPAGVEGGGTAEAQPTFRGGAPRAEVAGRSKFAAAPGVQAPLTLRSNFSETAFWQPHLVTGADGTAAIELTVPDSVTSWSIWVHALTQDLRSGADHREARSVKELMVRPYLPRFLREGDHADLQVVVADAAEQAFDGVVTLDILDPDKADKPDEPREANNSDDGASLLGEFGLAPAAARLPFHVEAGKSARVTFPLAVPKRVGQVAFRIAAAAGGATGASDGELRPLPILPSRVHLAQSRFAALHDRETRTLTFDDLKRTDDPSRIDERLVVTLDAQLFDSVLAAVPYLVEFPHECTEQTLNRFLSTAILTSLFDRYPAVGRMAQDLAARRDTEHEAFDGADANRRMALEETPWLLESQGKEGDAGERPLIKVLDPRIAAAQRQSALAKLGRDQLPSGAFPWWSGGPPSDFMTLYILYGFAKAGEFGVAVPREIVTKAWRYLGDRYEHELRRRIAAPHGDGAWELLTFMNYVASAYPDPSWLGDALPVAERRRLLDASFRHWKEHTPYLKGLLALTLQRMGRPRDARLVFDSVMDAARTTPDEGTFWQPEDRSWLWYNDTLETHAFALRALLELRPEDPRLPGLVQWLFLNKQLNHWKSTRATAEVIYSIAKYLASRHQLAVREAVKVDVAGATSDFVFAPDAYTGKKVQIVVPGEHLGPRDATITVSKETPGMLFAAATWHFSIAEPPREARGDLFAVERRYFRRLQQGKEMVLEPLTAGAAVAPGDEIEVQLSLRSRAPAEYVHLSDPRPAGFEPGVAASGWRWDLGLERYEEVRDSGTSFFFESLPAGQYTLKYRVRAALGGTFRVGPATVQSMYAPEFTAYSAGDVVRVAAAAP